VSAYWPPYAVDLRGLPACPCQAEWIPAFERHLGLTVPGFQGTLGIAQLIGTFSGSGGTHGDPQGDGLRKGGGVSDFWVFGAMADLVVAEARKMGADPTWHRPAGWDGPGSDEHVHCGLRGCRHRTADALAQEWAVDHDGDGLVGDAPDPGPRPLSGRTWREGIQWAREQEDVVTPQEKQDIIDGVLAGVREILSAEPAIGLKRADGTKKDITRDAATERILNPDVS